MRRRLSRLIESANKERCLTRDTRRGIRGLRAARSAKVDAKVLVRSALGFIPRSPDEISKNI